MAGGQPLVEQITMESGDLTAPRGFMALLSHPSQLDLC